MRGIAGGLSLPQLAALDLPETVIRVVRAHERQTGVKVDLELDTLPEGVGLPLKITVYRLVQEALNNAFRHAQGQGERVYVCTRGNRLYVEVSDQGPGFDRSQVSGWEGHLGLRSMQERVESQGGQLEIESAAGRGTRIRAYLPIAKQGDGND
jgi:signal transduction histidine kinase